MKPRELGGQIQSATACYAWVWLTDEIGVWINISKEQARELRDAAKDEGINEMLAFVRGGEVHVGDDEENYDAGADVESEEEDASEEEEEEASEEEEDASEEEEADEEEEETPAPVAAATATRAPARAKGKKS